MGAAQPSPAIAEPASPGPEAGLPGSKSEGAPRQNGPAAANRVPTVTLEGKDPLDVWRRSLLTRLSDEARRKAPGLGLAMPRRGDGERGETRVQGHTKVLKKTTKVLQRTKKLKSLKMKQKLVRESAGAKTRKP